MELAIGPAYHVVRQMEIRHIAVPRIASDLFATAAFDADVTVWSLSQLQPIASMKTVFSFGGSRLALCSGGNTVVVAAGWGRGVAAYDLTGQTIWTRGDIREVQEVRDLSTPEATLFGVGSESGSYAILNGSSGATVSELRGVRHASLEPSGNRIVGVSRRKVSLVHWDGRVQWSVAVGNPVLNAESSDLDVLISEMGGLVRCLDATGKAKWEYHSPKGHHVLDVCWCAARARWVAIEWNYEVGRPRTIVELTSSGSDVVADISESGQTALVRDGLSVVTKIDGVLRIKVIRAPVD